MVWRQAGAYIDQDPSIISRIVRSPRVGSSYRARHGGISRTGSRDRESNGWRHELMVVGRRAVSCPNGNKTGATAGRLH
jgi:hypothetical protein